MVSALSGGGAQRAWALNALCALSFRQELRLSATPGLLAALLPVGGWRWAGGARRTAAGQQAAVLGACSTC